MENHTNAILAEDNFSGKTIFIIIKNCFLIIICIHLSYVLKMLLMYDLFQLFQFNKMIEVASNIYVQNIAQIQINSVLSDSFQPSTLCMLTNFVQVTTIKYTNTCNCVNFPTSLKDVLNFENSNPGIFVNVFGKEKVR